MKETLGLIAAILAVVSHAPYIKDILHSRTRPHVFSWVIWSIVTLLVFFGQLQEGAGPGAWTTGITGLTTILIAFLAFKQGSKDITKSDVIFFSAALATLIPWKLTNNPTISIILLTLIDILAFIPTLRKTIKDPSSETFLTYFLNLFRHGLSIPALATYNLATVLFPAVMLLLNGTMVSVILKSRVKK